MDELYLIAKEAERRAQLATDIVAAESWRLIAASYRHFIRLRSRASVHGLRRTALYY